MDVLFPFGFPLPTAFYLVCYLLTLVIHVVFMNYVLAGSTWLAFQSLIRRPLVTGEPEQESNPISTLLRDWMPFMLSLAITAAVAPLLFLQILYQHQFYTANLLLFHRWMLILPALIVGFYLLYVLRSQFVKTWAGWLQAATAAGVFLCFGFIGWSWTENHLLSLHQSDWADHYASSALLYSHTQLWPRLALWFVGAFPTFALLIGWQLWFPYRCEVNTTIPGTRRMSLLAISGLILSLIAGGIYFSLLPEQTRNTLTGPLCLPWAMLLAGGLLMELLAWILIRQRQCFCKPRLLLASLGRLLSILAATVLREGIRLSQIDITALYPKHEQSYQISGFLAFLCFFVLNAALLTWCIVQVKKHLGQAAPK